jgi:hypothetical protein
MSAATSRGSPCGGWLQQTGKTSRGSPAGGWETEIVGAGGIIISGTVAAISVAGVAGTITQYWVDPANVKLGVTYGPNGNDFTGTLVSGGGGMASRVIGSPVIRRLH